MKHNPSKNLSEKLAPFGAIALLIVIIWALSMTPAKAQSFYTKRGHVSLQSAGQHIKVKTFGQKIRTKVQYARKRHNNERFAFRNMRQRSRAKQI